MRRPATLCIALTLLAAATARAQQPKDSTHAAAHAAHRAASTATKPREAASGMASGKRTSTGSAETAIREIDRKWVAAFAAKDTAYIRSIHAPDAVDLPPNMKIAEGQDAVMAGWAGFANMPGVKLDFSADNFVVSASGDLAVETGTWKFEADDPKNAGQKMADNGKFVVVWKKLNGEWKVVRDIWNSDRPLPGM